MSAGSKLKVQDELVTFWCPGCEAAHSINVGDDIKPSWGWNGSVDKPTFTPSILARGGHYAQPDKQCWCTYRGDTKFKCFQCHSYVTDGCIQFLSDCSHQLAGQIVDLKEFPQ